MTFEFHSSLRNLVSFVAVAAVATGMTACSGADPGGEDGEGTASTGCALRGHDDPWHHGPGRPDPRPAPRPDPRPAPSAQPTTFHLVGGEAIGVRPGGNLMSLAGTGANGFYPTAPVNGSPHFWYSPPSDGDFPRSTASLVLWTNSPGASSVVTVRLETVNDDGSRGRVIGEAAADVNASGTGNHTTTFGPIDLPAIEGRGQRLRLSVERTRGVDAVTVFNGGSDFDSRLVLTPTNNRW